MNNMKSLFVEMVRNADMVLFNRASMDMPLASFRRSVKVVNQGAEIIFEDEEGEIEDIFAEKMPFDVDADVIEIMDEDYGIWFVDAMDHPENLRRKNRILYRNGTEIQRICKKMCLCREEWP
mgnify:CR=1 FL=1